MCEFLSVLGELRKESSKEVVRGRFVCECECLSV